MNYHHKSGAQKRRERDAKKKESVKGRITLQSLGVTISPRSPKPSSSAAARGSKSDATELYSASCLTGITSSTSENEQNNEKLNFDIGLRKSYFTTDEIEDAVRRGPEPYPAIFPPDHDGMKFPVYVLNCRLRNDEVVPRDWLVWSETKQALFCFPCRLFCKLSELQRSIFATEIGWGPSKSYRKLYDRIPDHESSNNHKACYVQWRNLQNNLNKNTTVNCLLLHKIKSEMQVWKDLLRRFLDVILFISERGLAFRGSNNLIGDLRNGNFLGMLEIISHYDPLLDEHLKRVKESQIQGKRMQVHYLSAEIQNEFISCCAANVLNCILKEREVAKYFSIIVDATPDSAHMEQTTFILRYVLTNRETNEYEIFERFIEFVDCNKKTGDIIASLLLQTLRKRNIPISECRAQGYDNGSNMSGTYKGVQVRILEINPLAIFSPCACHSLNLCGVHAAECCPEVITFFGVVQKLYNIFSSSPQRWEILQKNTGCSLHSMSNTRWCARTESVKPFAKKLPSIKESIDMVLEFNLTADTQRDLNGIKTYMESFECLVMATVWFKVLSSINYRSTVLQARNSTIDIEVANLSSLLIDLKKIRNSWEAILNECKLVAVNLNTQAEFSGRRQRKRKRNAEESTMTPTEVFKFDVFNVLLDSVIGGITTRFDAAKNINTLFNVLWLFHDLNDVQIGENARKLQNKYKDDVSEQLSEELIHLKSIYDANIQERNLSPIQLLNKINHLNLKPLFPNIVIALRLFCTIPVTVAQAERSFSCLSRIKSVLRSTMGQSRLSSLGLLSIEAELARHCDFSQIIDTFASRKARKAPL